MRRDKSKKKQKKERTGATGQDACSLQITKKTTGPTRRRGLDRRMHDYAAGNSPHSSSSTSNSSTSNGSSSRSSSNSSRRSTSTYQQQWQLAAVQRNLHRKLSQRCPGSARVALAPARLSRLARSGRPPSSSPASRAAAPACLVCSAAGSALGPPARRRRRSPPTRRAYRTVTGSLVAATHSSSIVPSLVDS